MTTKARQDASSTRASAKDHHTILSLDVDGGFLDGTHFAFADGLNCVIGGRGTGKTTVLEFVRYVLDQMPDEKTSAARARSIKGLIQSNLSAGRIRLGVRTKHGMEYQTNRLLDDSPQVFNEKREAIAVSFDRDLIFKADVYSQNQIEEIATNPSFQLALLDKFIEEDVRRIDGEVRKLQRDLTQNAADLVHLSRGIRDLRDSATEATVLGEKLKAFQETAGPNAQPLNIAHARRGLREKERKTLEALRVDVRKARTEVGSVLSGLALRLSSRIDAEITADMNGEIFRAISTRVAELTSLLDRGAQHIGQQALEVDGLVASQERILAERHAKQDAEYRDLVAKSHEETGRAKERIQLQQRHADVLAAQNELQLRRRELHDKETHRKELTAKLSTLSDERFLMRKRIADHLCTALHPSIRVGVTQAGNKDSYRSLLLEALKGQGMKYTAVVERIVQSASPAELAAHVEKNDPTRLSQATGLDEDRCHKVLEALSGTELIYQIETVTLEDLPRIELLDGKDYKDSAELSTGQRCTTILPILLLESERPLLIDQPEDNLDNAFIYETIVKSLKEAKGKRQLIFVTHNPNIPVLGEAERVFVLTSDGKQSKLSKVGTVDELKREVEMLLEGGSEAFLLRKQRYGH